jgi:hypothetical protein
MNHWIWLVSPVGILSTAMVCGTDMFFLTIGRPPLRLALPSAGTEIMGFFHVRRSADANLERLSDLVQLLAGRVEQEWQGWFYIASLFMLILFVIIYNRLSKPINRLQTEAAKAGEDSTMVESYRRRGIDW